MGHVPDGHSCGYIECHMITLQISRNSKSNVSISSGGISPTSCRRPQWKRWIHPRTTTTRSIGFIAELWCHPLWVRSFVIVDILDPLPRVAVKIEDTPGIRFVLIHLCDEVKLFLSLLVRPRYPKGIKITIFISGICFRRVKEIAPPIWRCGSCTTHILPFHLSQKPIFLARGFCQPRTILYCLIPRYHNCR